MNRRRGPRWRSHRAGGGGASGRCRRAGGGATSGSRSRAAPAVRSRATASPSITPATCSTWRVPRPSLPGVSSASGIGSRSTQRRAAIVVGGHRPRTRSRSTPAARARGAPRLPARLHPRLGRAAGDDGGKPANFHEWVLERFGDGARRPLLLPVQREALPGAVRRAEPRLGRPVRSQADPRGGGRRRPRPARPGGGLQRRLPLPPPGGIRLLPDAVAEGVPELRLESEVVGVHLGERWIETADGSRDGFDRLVSTISLPGLVDLIRRRAAGGGRRRAGRPALGPGAERRARRRGRRALAGALAVLSGSGAAFLPGRVSLQPRPSWRPRGATRCRWRSAWTPRARTWRPRPARPKPRSPRPGCSTRAGSWSGQLTVVDPAYVVFDHQRRSAVACLRRFLVTTASCCRGGGRSGSTRRWRTPFWTASASLGV